MSELIDITAIRTDFDCRAVAARYVTLDGQITGHKELHGPCPKCGGRDRFFVSPGIWGCRVCGTGGDVVKLIQHAEGLEFLDAVEFLTKGARSQRPVVRPSKLSDQQPAGEDDEAKRRRFLAHAPVKMDAAHRRLMEEDTPGGAYLLDKRGLHLETWHRFGLGYVDDACGAGPAVAMPWYRAGKLTAIRYRLLEPKGKQKLISESGSRSAGLLFGGQVLVAPTKHADGRDDAAKRTLVLVEGEINAMSIWQEMGGAPVDVLSMGGESSALSAAAVALAQRYRAVIVWMDKETRAREKAQQVGGLAYWSEAGGQKCDANDHLRAGRLGDIMAHLWAKATKPEHGAALAQEMLDWTEGARLDRLAATA